MNAAQLRAAATRARAARQTVHLLPGDAEALADELDRLVGVFDNERCDAAYWKERAEQLAAEVERLRVEAVAVAHLTAEAEALADVLAGALEG